MNQKTADERIERARRVKMFTESDEWRSAWDAYRETLLNVIETADDDAKALDARRMLRAARKARTHLEMMVNDGKLASADMASRKSNLRIA